jgi:cytochrome c2
MAKVKFYNSQFNYAFKDPSGNPIGRYLRRKGVFMTAGAKIQAGYKTGALKKSISMSQTRQSYGQKLVIKATAPHALVHHEGATPHIIMATGGKSLKFVGKTGGFVYRKAVKHPGHKSNKYLSDQLNKFIR